jgi:DNA polymerase III delta subunit
MVLLIHGNDIYRAKRKLYNLYTYAHQKQASIEDYDIQDLLTSVSQSDIRQRWQATFQGQSLFQDKKLIIIRQFSALPSSVQTSFLNLMYDCKDYVIIFFEAKKLPKKQKLYTYIQNYGKEEEFSPLQGAKLKAYIQKIAQLYSTSLSEDSLSLLINTYGHDLYPIALVINKVHLAFPEELILPKSAVQKEIPQSQEKIFALSSYYWHDKHPSMLSLLQNIEHTSTDPTAEGLKTLAFLITQTKKALAIRACLDYNQDYKASIEGNAYGLDMIKQNIQSMSYHTLLVKYHALVEIDHTIKVKGVPSFKALKSVSL